MVTNKSQSDSSFCVIINIFENKGLFMMHKKIRNKDYYIFILTERMITVKMKWNLILV